MPRGARRLRTSDDKMNGLGERVKEQRLVLKMTQDALCGRVADLTKGNWVPDWRDVYRIESGSRIVSDLETIALATALGCAPAWLLTG